MFSLAELANRLSKTDVTSWTQEPPRHALKETPDWVENFLGFSEESVISKASQMETKKSIDKLLSKYAIYDEETGVLATPLGNYQAGWFVCPSVDEIIKVLESLHDRVKKGKPRVRVLVAKEGIGQVIADGSQFGIYQANSRINALEIPDQYKRPRDGIRYYEERRGQEAQGSQVAMAAGPGTFVRNYWVPQQLGGQFNGLCDVDLDHQNGYLVWSDFPFTVEHNLEAPEAGRKIRIPAMLYTQVVGKNCDGPLHRQKLVHQIFSYSAPLMDHGNIFDEELRKNQMNIVKKLLTATYTGAIGLGLILKTWDAQRGVNNRINLTPVGIGDFNNPLKTIYKALRDALDCFSGYDFDVDLVVSDDFTVKIIEEELPGYFTTVAYHDEDGIIWTKDQDHPESPENLGEAENPDPWKGVNPEDPKGKEPVVQEEETIQMFIDGETGDVYNLVDGEWVIIQETPEIPKILQENEGQENPLVIRDFNPDVHKLLTPEQKGVDIGIPEHLALLYHKLSPRDKNLIMNIYTTKTGDHRHETITECTYLYNQVIVLMDFLQIQKIPYEEDGLSTILRNEPYNIPVVHEFVTIPTRQGDVTYWGLGKISLDIDTSENQNDVYIVYPPDRDGAMKVGKPNTPHLELLKQFYDSKTAHFKFGIGPQHNAKGEVIGFGMEFNYYKFLHKYYTFMCKDQSDKMFFIVDRRVHANGKFLQPFHNYIERMEGGVNYILKSYNGVRIADPRDVFE